MERLKREARVWEPIPLETRVAFRRFVVEAVVMTAAAIAVAALALVLSSCTVHVTVRHELKAPVRCRMDHRARDLGFTCAQEPLSHAARSRPGLEVPPL